MVRVLAEGIHKNVQENWGNKKKLDVVREDGEV